MNLLIKPVKVLFSVFLGPNSVDLLGIQIRRPKSFTLQSVCQVFSLQISSPESAIRLGDLMMVEGKANSALREFYYWSSLEYGFGRSLHHIGTKILSPDTKDAGAPPSYVAFLRQDKIRSKELNLMERGWTEKLLCGATKLKERLSRVGEEVAFEL